MRVGDLVRCTAYVQPYAFEGKLAVIITIRDSSYIYPYEIKMLDDGEILPVDDTEIELPDEGR